MEPVPKRKACLAVDLGAQSCRVSLLRWPDGEPKISVVHRLLNAPLETADGLRWDLEKILDGVMQGLGAAAALAPEGVASIAIDGWAVDYVRLNEDGQPTQNPYCYRDPRTEAAEREVHAVLSPQRLYALTGVQILRINTLYQLYADKLARRDHGPWLLLPEYVAYRLGGRRVAEYTNATHTALVELGRLDWCRQIFDELGLDWSAAPEMVSSGTVIGAVKGQLQELPAFRGTKLIVAATHDTAAAVAGVPAAGNDWAFISSGTWSLVGTVLASPCVDREARELNFTNLGGAGGSTCFLKNVNGMWTLSQCMEEWERDGHPTSVAELVAACEGLPRPPALIDVDEPQLLLPGNALEKINAQLERLGHPPFRREKAEIPRIGNLLFHSLAARYAAVLRSIEQITGKRLRRLFIVGGGSQNHYLNRLTAERSGLAVLPGPVESTTIGNFAIQLAALDGDWSPSGGVVARAVAHYAEQLIGNSLALSSDRKTD
jgi:rhamnulokinase